MIVNETKKKRQLEGIDKVIANFHKGLGATLEWATGVGKTFATTLLLQRMLEINPNRKTIIIVPRIPLKKQWEDYMEKLGIQNVEVYVINTFVNMGAEGHRFQCSLLVLDEAHRYGGDAEEALKRAFVKLFDYVDNRFLLCLTATIKRLDNMHEILIKKAPVVDTITLEEARKNGWVADFMEFNLGITLSRRDEIELANINKKFNSSFAWFNHDFATVMRVTTGETQWISPAMVISVDQPPKGMDGRYIIKNRQGQYIRRGRNGYYFIRNSAKIFAEAMGHEEKDIRAQAAIWSKAMRDRKQFLYKNSSKLKAIMEILQKLPKKTIIFSESTEFVDNLTELIGEQAVSYHSKRTIRQNREALRRMKAGEASVMVTAKALDEGHDDDTLEMGIIASYTSNPTQNIQRKGRIVRLLEGVDKLAIIINLYIKGVIKEGRYVPSQEEKWLRSAQYKMSNIHNVENINELLAIIDYATANRQANN